MHSRALVLLILLAAAVGCGDTTVPEPTPDPASTTQSHDGSATLYAETSPVSVDGDCSDDYLFPVPSHTEWILIVTRPQDTSVYVTSDSIDTRSL